MTMTDKKEKLDQLTASAKPSNWAEKAKWKKENSGWLKKSSRIAIKILAALRQKKMSQKGLAELMNSSPQYINKLLSGKENLTLETIARLEHVLGIELISVTSHSMTIEVAAISGFSKKEELIPFKGNRSTRPLQQPGQYFTGQLTTAA